MKKMYHLANCDTCARIIQETGADAKLELQDIKTEKITAEQLDQMAKMAGSYEALFSRKAMKYRAMGLHEKQLSESDYRNLILEEYTFLKRPVSIVGTAIFVGNDKKTVSALAEALQ